MKNIIFIGSKEIGLNVLKKMHQLSPEKLTACITVKDLSDTRSKWKEITCFCDANKVPVHSLEGKYDLSPLIDLYQPEMCFVIGWYYLIPSEVLQKVPYGFVGIHNSLLPRYRGHAPLVWAMIQGEKVTGYTVFSLDQGMDTGKIWYQEAVDIEYSDYVSDVLLKIEHSIIKFLEYNYVNMLNGSLHPYSQLEVDVSYGAKRVEADGQIDWKLHKGELYNFIRAQSRPYPGAFSYYANSKVTIWKVREFPYFFYGRPGQVGLIDKTNGEIIVACGYHTAIVLEEIEVEGKLLKPIEFINTINKDFL